MTDRTWRDVVFEIIDLWAVLVCAALFGFAFGDLIGSWIWR
jgi:hypothetical protein